MDIELFPLEKITLDGVALTFGMERADVEAILGKGQRVGARYYYFGSELAVDYRDDRLDFVEFLGGIDGTLRPTLFGVSVFDVPADAFVALLREHDGAVLNNERGYSYQFPTLSVGVYREAIPEEVASMIEEATSAGTPMSATDIALERRRAEHWATVGLGSAGYYLR